jgi:hypothetical protein
MSGDLIKKTRLSARAVPLQAKAIEALDRLPLSGNPILFPNARGGRIDFRIFGRKHWKPAQTRAGVELPRGIYDLRPSRRSPGLRRLAIPGLEHHRDRPALRPPRPRQPRARSSTLSRSKGPWTLRGRRPKPSKRQSGSRFQTAGFGNPEGAWTLRGRRPS